MYELNQVSKNCFYIQSPAKIGLIKLNEKDVCLIDSGNDKEAGKKVRQILESNNWNLKTIYNTHSNADHIGGNKYLQSQTGCKIFAPTIESAFIKSPVLEPSFLYGGFPFKDLKHKFLMAQESDIEVLSENKLPNSLKSIDLKGHFFNMVGFKHSDGVVYLADCLSSKAILDKYKITFIYDVKAYIETLEKVKIMEAKIFIPSHSDATENIKELAQYNIDTVNEIADLIVKLLNEPMTFEKLLKTLFDYYKLQMTPEQYVLVGSTVRSYLSYLKDNEKIEFLFVGNEMLWRAL